MGSLAELCSRTSQSNEYFEGGWQITDAGLVQLAGLNLLVLDIPEQSQTDLGLKHYLAALEPQTDLNLSEGSGWQVTDTGLVHLMGLTNLEKLFLNRKTRRCPYRYGKTA